MRSNLCVGAGLCDQNRYPVLNLLEPMLRVQSRWCNCLVHHGPILNKESTRPSLICVQMVGPDEPWGMTVEQFLRVCKITHRAPSCVDWQMPWLFLGRFGLSDKPTMCD